MQLSHLVLYEMRLGSTSWKLDLNMEDGRLCLKCVKLLENPLPTTTSLARIFGLGRTRELVWK